VHRDRAYFNITERRLWLIDEFDLSEPHRLIGVKITQERADRSRTSEIVADKAEHLDGEWWLYGAEQRDYSREGYPIGEMKPLPGSERGAPAPSLTESPADFINELKPWEFLSTLEMRRYLQSHPQLSETTAAHKWFDLHSRLAMPWACLIVTLFGIPAGASSGRQSVLTGILLAISFFFGFYVLNQVGIFLGKREIVWPWVGAWLSNIVFLSAGAAMAFRMK